MKLNMLSAKNKTGIKTCVNVKDFLPKDSSSNSLTKIGHHQTLLPAGETDRNACMLLI